MKEQTKEGLRFFGWAIAGFFAFAIVGALFFNGCIYVITLTQMHQIYRQEQIEAYAKEHPIDRVPQGVLLSQREISDE